MKTQTLDGTQRNAIPAGWQTKPQSMSYTVTVPFEQMAQQNPAKLDRILHGATDACVARLFN